MLYPTISCDIQANFYPSSVTNFNVSQTQANFYPASVANFNVSQMQAKFPESPEGLGPGGPEGRRVGNPIRYIRNP